MSSDLEARVDRVMPSRESPLYALVEITLTNRSAAALRVQQLKVVWPGGDAAYEPNDLIVGAGQQVQRRIQVGPERGDVAGLLKAGAAAVRIDILARR